MSLRGILAELRHPGGAEGVYHAADLRLPVACTVAWGFEATPRGVRSLPHVPKDTRPAPRAPEATIPPSIAALPFVDMSAEHVPQYLGDGIAEELLNSVASIESLDGAAWNIAY
jgi:hypothetical protein